MCCALQVDCTGIIKDRQHHNPFFVKDEEEKEKKMVNASQNGTLFILFLAVTKKK